MEKDRINDTEKSFLSGKKRMDKLKVLMKYAGISVFEYFPDSDRMVLYNEQLEEEKGIMPFLGQLGQICTIHPEDVQKMREFLLGQTLGTVELKLLEKGHYKRILLDALQKEEGDRSVIGCIRDITEIRKREELLEDQARRDSMTGLYNHDTGKLLVNEYLREKRMDASSGLLMLDVDHFKNVNDVVAYVNKYSKSMFTFIDKNINVQFKNTIDQSNNDSILRKEKTTYFVNSVTPDGQVALNIDFYLKNNALENSEERQLKVKLPLKYSIKGIKYNNKILDTSEFTISTDNVVTLPIEEENGRYTIYTNLGKSCLISSYAKLEYKKQNKLYNENIGAISEKCFNISFDTSDEINFSEGESKVKTLIRGEGPKNENVDVYVDGKLDKSINISKTGRFETNVELLNPEDYKEYDIEIKSTSADGKQKVVSKKVTTLLDCPKLIEASLYIEAHEYKNGYNEFNILNADKIKYITFFYITKKAVSCYQLTAYTVNGAGGI